MRSARLAGLAGGWELPVVSVKYVESRLSAAIRRAIFASSRATPAQPAQPPRSSLPIAVSRTLRMAQVMEGDWLARISQLFRLILA